MKKLSLLSVLLLVACANDPQSGAVVGGAVGGATGAGVGYGVGGRDGAILGGAIGGAVGASVGQNQSRTNQSAPVYQPNPQRAHRDDEYNKDKEHDNDNRHSRRDRKHEDEGGKYRD